MIIWVIKMLLKFMKPIAKIAIMAGLLDTLLMREMKKNSRSRPKNPLAKKANLKFIRRPVG